jgi:outer membrane protein TolC
MKRFVLTLAIISWTCIASLAVDHIAGILSLEDCFNLLEDRNSQLQAARENIAAAQAHQKVAIGRKYPDISAGASYSVVSKVMKINFPGQTIPLPPPTGPLTTPGHQISFGDGTTADLNLSLGIPLYTGGAITDNIRLADLSTNAAQASYQQLWQDLRLQLRRLYFDFLKAQQAVEIALKDVQQSQLYLDDVNNRLQEGMAIDLDVLEARTALGQSRQNLLTKTNQNEQARLALLSILELPQDSPITFSLMGWDKPPEPDQIPGQDSTFDSRAEVRKVLLQIDAAHVARNLEASNQRPTLSFAGAGHYARPGLDPVKDEWMAYASAGLNLDFTLFRGGAVKAQIEEKQKNVDALDKQRQSIERQIVLQRQSANLALNTAKGQWELAVELLKNARERFRVAESMWKQGVATETAYQDAQDALTQAELSVSVSILDYWLAVAEMIYANGEQK